MSLSEPSSVSNPTYCEFCDVETQQALASRLLHTLAIRATLRKCTPDEAVSKLREKLLPPPSGKKNPAPSLAVLDTALKAAEDIRAKGLAYFNSKEEMQRRVSTCEQDLELSFRQTRRERLAAELIRAYDVGREYHCGHALSGDGGESCSPTSAAASERHRLGCIFRPLACRNEGCVAIFSARSEAEHDMTCGFKRLPCTRGCHAMVERQMMAEHIDGVCPNKPVDCPFFHLGCTHACTQGTLEDHVQTATAVHLSLTLRVITMQQHAINTLEAAGAAALTAASDLAAVTARVSALESGLNEMKLAVQQSATELRAAMAKDVEALTKQHIKDHKKLDDGLSKVTTTVTKAHGALDKEHRADMERLRKTVDEAVARLNGGR